MIRCLPVFYGIFMMASFAAASPPQNYSSPPTTRQAKAKAGKVYSSIQWASLSFEQALARARQEKRSIFLDMYATWCYPCKKYDRLVFSQSKVATYIHRHFVPLRRNGYRGEGNLLRRRYNCVTFPCLLVIDANGQEVERITRFQKAPLFLSRMKEIRGGKDTLQSLSKQLKKQPNNPLLKFRVGYRLAYRGDPRCVSFLRAVSVKPPPGFPHLASKSLYVLGRIYYRNTRRNWGKAAEVFREFLQRFPNHRKAKRVQRLLRHALLRLQRRR